MSANRRAWIAVGVVVLVVAVLVARSLREGGGAAPGRSAPGATDVARAKEPKEHGIEPSSAARAKQVLKDRGYYNGPINADYNPEVAEALKKFQKDAGMKPTGHLDEQTYKALGIELRKHR